MTREQIRYGLDNQKLKLIKWENFSHYSIVGFCFIIPLTITFFHLKAYFENTKRIIASGEIWHIIVPVLLGIFLYFLQKSRLKFKEVHTNLNKQQLLKIIEKVAIKLEWNAHFSNSSVIVVKTHPGFLSGSWGEQITILFDNKKVLINSICDPAKKSSIVSMGRNKQNENLLITEIKKANSLQKI